MKCNNCNYEYKWEWKNNKKTVVKGDKGEWIEVKITAHSFVIDREDYSYEDKETQIYACPNCGTIRLNDYDLSTVIDQREWKIEREKERVS